LICCTFSHHRILQDNVLNSCWRSGSTYHGRESFLPLVALTKFTFQCWECIGHWRVFSLGLHRDMLSCLRIPFEGILDSPVSSSSYYWLESNKTSKQSLDWYYYASSYASCFFFPIINPHCTHLNWDQRDSSSWAWWSDIFNVFFYRWNHWYRSTAFLKALSAKVIMFQLDNWISTYGYELILVKEVFLG